MVAILNSTYDTGGVLQFSNTNPQVWHTGGHLLLPIAPNHLVFQGRLPQTIRRLGYIPRHLVFLTLLLQALARLVYNTSHLVFLPILPQALPRLRLQRPLRQTLPNSRAGVRHLVLTILTVGNHAAILYFVYIPRHLFSIYFFFRHSLGSVPKPRNLVFLLRLPHALPG